MQANAVRLQLHALAYNLANFFRTLVLPQMRSNAGRWPRCARGRLSSTRRSPHARYTVFQMAEVAVPRDLFRRILAMIDGLRPGRIARC